LATNPVVERRLTPQVIDSRTRRGQDRRLNDVDSKTNLGGDGVATREREARLERLFENLGEPKPPLRQVQAIEAPGVTHIRYVLTEDR
jgi:hypothetical protein